jgi:lipoate-protein ligase A
MTGPMPFRAAPGDTWRVLDTGLRSAAENIALDRAILESHEAGDAPCTLRFLRFAPSALVGFHQSVRHELDLDYCQANGVEIQRRITGGGAIYFDETQLGWELFLGRRLFATGDMTAVSARICEAAARGIRRLGVEARYRPRNDIEVNGRKIAGTGGAFDGASLLFQGTLLVDFDVERMLRVLRIPAEKLSDKAIRSARERVGNLKDLLGRGVPLEDVQGCLIESFGEEFGVRFVHGALTPAEDECYRAALAEIETPDWVWQTHGPDPEGPLIEGLHRCSGGLLRAQVLYGEREACLKRVWYSGDFFVSPRGAIVDLEAALRDIPVVELGLRLREFFRTRAAEMLLLTPEDFLAPVLSALAPQADGGRVQG